MKTNELTGAALDWAVANCEDLKTKVEIDGIVWLLDSRGDISRNFNPSSSWIWGGPIIEREKIAVVYRDEKDEWEVPNWSAWPTKADDRTEIMGETPLIAAMRCYVASKRGGEVEVPDELH